MDNIAGIVTFTPTADPGAGIGGTFGWPMNLDGYPIRLSNYVHEFASDFKFTGSKIEIQFLNPLARDGGYHYGDFYIGLTDKTPIVSAPDVLTEWSGVNWINIETGNAGSGNTSVLNKKDVLYGEFNHDYAGYDQDGVETIEAKWDRGNAAYRMSIDDRIPPPKGAATGHCSKVKYEVLDPVEITGISQVLGNPDPSISDSDYYLVKNPPGATFPATVNEFDGGQVAVEVSGTPTASNSRFVGLIQSYFDTTENKDVYYIKIDQSLGTSFESGEFSIFIRPVMRTTENMVNRSKLYNYEPWPLYLTGNLKDNAVINNITVKETVGDFERTITPRLYVKGNISVTNASNNASTLGEAPPHYQEVNRLSSALYDNQDEQNLRPGVVRDTFYVGAGDSKNIDMSKIFNPDRDSITPDNNNLEATFFVAEKIDSGSAGQIQATVTYTEQ